MFAIEDKRGLEFPVPKLNLFATLKPYGVRLRVLNISFEDKIVYASDGKHANWHSFDRVDFQLEEE